MTLRSTSARTLLALAGLACCAPIALAQDSVSASTGVGGDAIEAYDTSRQTVRYVVDLVPLTTSWGNTWGIAPLAKASRDEDVLFNTMALGAAGVSPDMRTGVALGGAEQTFGVWTIAGQGVGAENSVASSVNAASLDHYFGVAMSDLNLDASNAIGVLVGYNDAQPDRLYVRRTLGAQSRSFSFLDDNGTVYATAIDANANLHVKADDYNGSGSTKISGQNIVTIDLLGRGSGLNGIANSGVTNTAFDSGASTFTINDGVDTLNTPTALPDAGAPLTLNFKGEHIVGADAPLTNHLDAGIDGHRGNATFSKVTGFGGVGTVASLARAASTPGRTASINVFGVDASGNVQTTGSATLPSPLPGTSLNASDNALFDQYNNQTSFRGPSGHVAIGRDNATGDVKVAATATDPGLGDFIAVATFGASTTWDVAAKIGDPVLDGAGGSAIGTLADAAFGAISAPAMDLYGNVYFTGLFDDAINPVVPAVFKAVNTGSGYQLELVLKQGQQFTGANSNTLYTVETIALADSDSIASSGMSAASVLQQTDGSATDASKADTVGAVIVNATIAYARVGGPEVYDATLVLKPEKQPVSDPCFYDVNGTGTVDIVDFTAFSLAFGSTTGDPNYDPALDFNNTGAIDIVDFTQFASEFNRTDCQ